MKIKVLLLENIPKLGNKCDIVEVSDAYARNVLIKQNKAKIATKAIINEYEAKLKKKQKQQEELKNKVKSAIEKISREWLVIKVKASADNHLYEKIDKRHIINEFNRQFKFTPKDKEIDFPEKKVAKLGEYEFYYLVDGKKVKLRLKVERE